MKYHLLPETIKTHIDGLKTPFFLYDLDIVRRNVDLLRTHLAPDRIYYAVKCNSLPPILETLSECRVGFEINNLTELSKVANAVGEGHPIIDSSPLTPATDIQSMVANGVRHFVFDSKSHVDNLRRNAPGASVYLRVYSTNEGSRFELSKRLGAAPEDAADLIRYAADNGLKPFGLTFHVGSQCTQSSNWEAGLRACARLFREFPGLSVINLGGGFPVHYGGKNVPNIETLATAINDAIDRHFDRRPEIWIEPGRFMVGNAAITGTSVIQVEHQRLISRAIVDISVFSGLIEILETGNGFCYPIEARTTGPKQLYRVAGPTCAGTDIIAEELMLPRLTVDYQDPANSSRLYLSNTGAYTLDYIGLSQQNGFNGAPIPQVYYLKNGEILKHEPPSC